MTTSILIMNLDDNLSFYSPPSTCTIKMSASRALDPKQMQRHWTIVNEKTLGIFILNSFVTGRWSEQAWDQKFCPVQSGLFGAEVLHPRSNHSPLSFPPAFLGGTLSAVWNVFPSPMQTGALWFSRVMGYAAVRARGWKYLIWIMTLLSFLWTLIISMHILQSGHVVVQVSQKLRYKSWLYGVFYRRSLFGPDVISGWEKPRNIFCAIFWWVSKIPLMKQAHYWFSLSVFLFTLTFFSLWIHSIFLSQCHLSPQSFCWLEWFIHISNSVTWRNMNNVCISLASFISILIFTWAWLKMIVLHALQKISLMYIIPVMFLAFSYFSFTDITSFSVSLLCYKVATCVGGVCLNGLLKYHCVP